MQVKILRLQDERPVNEFLATGVNVSTKHVYLTKDGIPEVAIFYETALDDAAAKDRALIDQNAEMDRLIVRCRAFLPPRDLSPPASEPKPPRTYQNPECE